MSEQLSKLKDRYLALFDSGATYAQIATTLKVSPVTVAVWRKRLGLAPRRSERGPRLWRNTPLHNGIIPFEVLSALAKDLALSPTDVDFALRRTEKLRRMGVKTSNPIAQILTSAFLYLREPSAHRKPMDCKTFVALCRAKGHMISEPEIIRTARHFREKRIYQPDPSSSELLARLWPDLRERLGIPDSTRIQIREILTSGPGTSGRKPNAAIAGAIYIASERLGLGMSQARIARELHVSCLLYTSPSPRDLSTSRMPSSA